MAHVYVNNETPNMVSNDIKYIAARPHLMTTTTMSVSRWIGSRSIHDHNASDIVRNGGMDATQWWGSYESGWHYCELLSSLKFKLKRNTFVLDSDI